MHVSPLLCFLRDCMKGDETENKKIGCTVNLMVKTLPFSLCDTVQCCRNWGGKGWDGNVCQASVEGRRTAVVRIPWRSLVQFCLKHGHTGQVAQGLVHLSAEYPCDRGSITSLAFFFSF